MKTFQATSSYLYSISTVIPSPADDFIAKVQKLTLIVICQLMTSPSGQDSVSMVCFMLKSFTCDLKLQKSIIFENPSLANPILANAGIKTYSDAKGS